MSLEVDKDWLLPLDQAAEIQEQLRTLEEIKQLGAFTTKESQSQQGEI